MEFFCNLLENFPYLSTNLTHCQILNSAYRSMSDGGPLQKEFHKFFHHVKQLRRLQNETLEAIENVGKTGNLTEGRLINDM